MGRMNKLMHRNIQENDNWNDILKMIKKTSSKKVLLFIDGSIPRYDQAAGYFIVFEYLKIFIKNSYTVLYWPNDRQSPEPYTQELKKLGIIPICGEISFEKFIKMFGPHIDISMLCRAPIAKDYIESIQKNSKSKIVFNTIDLHYLRESRRARILTDKEEEAKSSVTKNEEISLIKQADISLFFSKEEIKEVNKEIFRPRTAIIPWIQDININTIIPYKDREGLVFLGDFLHNPNGDAINWFYEEILPIIKKTLPNINIFIIGGNASEDIKKLHSKSFRVLGHIDDLNQYFNKVKVFISPLRFGAGIKGKIAMAVSYGVPVVSTSVGVESMGLRNGESVMIADDPKSFAKKVIELYNNELLWNRISHNSYQYLKEHYSSEEAESVIIQILDNLYKEKRGVKERVRSIGKKLWKMSTN